MPDRIRLISYNIAHGRGLIPYQGLVPASRIRKNLTKIAGLIADARADVVAFQEIDVDSHWNGHIDQPAHLARASGLDHVCFGATTRREGLRPLHYGNAIISRLPLVEHRNRPFSKASLGGKGYQCAVVAARRATFGLVNLHLCYRSAANRRTQIDILLDDLRQLQRTEAPFVPLICGDFNACSSRPNDAVRTLERGLAALGLDYALHPESLPTFPSPHPWRKLDFLFIPASWRIHKITAPRSLLSDHLPLLVEFSPG